MKVKFSRLKKTWLIDLDGTIIEHNSHINGTNKLLPGVKKFWKKINKKDIIIILTARESKYRMKTIKFLKDNNLRYNKILFDLNVGERILINDKKPDGLKTSVSINVKRNKGLNDINFIYKDK